MKKIHIRDSPTFWRNIIGLLVILFSINNNNVLGAILFYVGLYLLLINWLSKIIKYY